MKQRLVIISLAMVISLTGCGLGKNKKEKVDYENLYGIASYDLEEQKQKVEGLQLALLSLDEKYKNEVDMARYMKLDTGETAFRKYNDKVFLNEDIKFDSVDSISNSSKLFLVNNISIAPSDSWVLTTTTAKTDLYNTNGITGQIELYKVYDSVAAEFIYDSFLKPFVEANALKVNQQQSLFLGSAKSGVEINTKLNLIETEYGNSKKRVKNKEVYSTEDIEAMQSVADLEVQESEATRIQEYMATMESTEPQTNESGEAIPVSLPETIAVAENVETAEVEVLLPNVTETNKPYIFKLGIVMNGGTAIVYKFVYEDNDKANSNSEILKSLITSMQIDTINITME